MVIHSTTSYNNRLFLGIALGLVVIFVFLTPVQAATIIVCPSGCNYSSIQAAINNATDGDVIEVYSGTYYENVVINNSVVLKGVDTGGGKPVIDAGGNDNVITVTADGVTVDGFIITNTSSWSSGIYITSDNNIIKNNTLSNINPGTGVYLYMSNNNIILDNDILGPSNDGIRLLNSNNNTISDNTLKNHKYGLVLDWSTYTTITNNTFFKGGIWIGGELEHWNTHTIENNTVNGRPLYYFKNQVDGKVPENAGQVILANCTAMVIENLSITEYTTVGIWLGFSSRNIVFNNTLSNNERGIYISNSNTNILTNNVISDNIYGIFLHKSDNNLVTGNTISSNYRSISLSESNNNTIKNNIFFNNYYSFHFFRSYNNILYLNNLINNVNNFEEYFSSNNFWNSTEKMTYIYNGTTYINYLGNYWNDYSGTDSNGDGIGDTPYSIDGVVDEHPLMERFENYNLTGEAPELQPPVANFTYSVSGLTVTFNASSSYDPDGQIVNYTWDFGDGNVESITSPTIAHTYSSEGTYTVILTVTDNDGLNNSVTSTLVVSKSVITVCPSGCDYTSIQAAINNATDGDVIEVYSGTYYENVVVNKSVVLRGVDTGGGKPVIDAQAKDAGITIIADGVTVEGFEITNGTAKFGCCEYKICPGIDVHTNNTTISKNIIRDVWEGIILRSSTANNKITGNTIESCEIGITIYSDNTTVYHNNISNNYDGIWMFSNNNTITDNIISNSIYYQGLTFYAIEYVGIYTENSNNNIIENNTISNNLNGIEFRSSTNNTIRNNTISNNSQGINLDTSSNNKIYENSIESNKNAGIYLSTSSNNIIYLNNFINNLNNVVSSNSINIWNSTEKITYFYNGTEFTNYLGNFYDDYNGSDTDGDGIGDTPYTTCGGEIDNYPLMGSYKNGNIIPADIPRSNIVRIGTCNYPSIQDAINNADPGDVIKVWSGTYFENVVVSKSVTLRGVDTGKGKPVVDAGGSGNAIEITADNAIIDGFVIKNGTTGISVRDSSNTVIRNNILENNEISLYRSNNNTIINNNVLHSSIFLENSNNNTLSKNTIIEGGIYITEGDHYLTGLSLSHYIHEIDTTNSVNGKPVYYIKNQVGGRVPEGAGQIILVNCSDIIIENKVLSNTTVGIQIVYSSNIAVRNNIIANNTMDGIEIIHSNNNTIENNTVSNNQNNGVKLIRYSSYNLIHNNIISYNGYAGINIGLDSPNNTISNNIIERNKDGIRAWTRTDNNSIINNIIRSNYEEGIHIITQYNIISNNTIEGNGDIGIYIGGYNNQVTYNNVINNQAGILAEGENNAIYLNNFMGNNKNIDDWQAWQMNKWYTVGLLITYVYNEQTFTNYLGNFWDDYTGSDEDGDGVGDTPREIGWEDADYYPLMDRFENYKIVSINKVPIVKFTYSPSSPKVGQTIKFNASSSYDPDGEIASYEWDFGDDNVTTTTSPIINHTYTKPGVYVVTLTVTDNEGATKSVKKKLWISSADITVCPSGGDYTSIQAAINNATDGDVIEVCSGEYREKVIVNKSVVLRGVITGESWDLGMPRIFGYPDLLDRYFGRKISTINITADNVTIEGFEIDCRDFYEGLCAAGIMINSNNNILRGNVIVYGISLRNANNNTIMDNIILTGDKAVYLNSSNNNKIIKNIIGWGVYGVYLSSSNDNIIYLNVFTYNEFNVYSEYSNNIWNSTEKITYFYNGSQYTNYLGNYWDDYTGSDTDGDGIGDTPYAIDGDADNYPLIDWLDEYFDTTPPTVEITYPTENTILRGTVSINGTAYDENLANYTITITNKNGETVYTYENTTSVTDGVLAVWDTATVPDGPYTITLTAYDLAENSNSVSVAVNVNNSKTRMKGDANDDGKITASDALLYLRYAVGQDISPYHLDPASDDVTCDGKITASDALKVLRKAVGQDLSNEYCPW